MTTFRQRALQILAISLTVYALTACHHSGPVPSISDPKTTEEAPHFCALKTSAPETWVACSGKLVRLQGTVPKIVLAHPNAGAVVTEQSYLEVGTRQIVVSSATAPQCSGSRVVTGILNKVDLGGPAGTRSSYQGWSITEATITCQ